MLISHTYSIIIGGSLVAFQNVLKILQKWQYGGTSPHREEGSPYNIELGPSVWSLYVQGEQLE